MEVTPRSLQLFDVLRHHSARTRFILVVLNVFSVILFAALLNEKFGGTRPRMDVRFWSTRLSALECNLRTPRCPGGSPKADPMFAGVDSAELEILREAQLSRFETVTVPILGVDVSAADVSLLAALALLILFIWFKLAIGQERRALVLLIYPLDAKEDADAASLYWGLPKHLPCTPENRKEWLSKRMSEYRNDIIFLREAISSQFLFMYVTDRSEKSKNRPTRPAGEAAAPRDQGARPAGEPVLPAGEAASPAGEVAAPGQPNKRRGKPWESFLPSVLVMLPVILLITCITLDFIWDFHKRFKETGMTYSAELASYANRLDSVAEVVPNPLHNRLKAAERDLRFDRTVLRVKRYASLGFLAFTILLAFGVLSDTIRMGAAVRAMYTAEEVPTPSIIEDRVQRSWFDRVLNRRGPDPPTGPHGGGASDGATVA
jgi:hypothetical protein